jgi:ElaB/YqjD/DUF883 family membrane-anchored ribosome-binding protein
MSYTQPLSNTPDTDALRRAATDLRDDVSASARDLAETAGEHVTRAREQAREWVNRSAARAKDAVTDLRDQAQAVGDRTQQYVRDEPLKSVAIAAVAGAAIAGLLMLWRQSSR